MHQKDKIKLGVAAALFSIIGVMYYIEGKSQFTKIVVGICAAFWLIIMYLLRNKKN